MDPKLKEKAISLRRKGKSYGDIKRALGLKSKGTLSAWFKKLPLSKKSQALLHTNNRLAFKRGLKAANANRKIRIDSENSESYNEGLKTITQLSDSELLLIGASLYWAEGVKSERGVSTPLVFTNSDPDMISVYMQFLRKILLVPEDTIRAGIHIYNNHDPVECRKFWANITGLPEDRFYIITQISRSSQNKRPFNILPYGTATIRVSNRKYFFKMKGMIARIIQGLIK